MIGWNVPAYQIALPYLLVAIFCTIKTSEPSFVFFVMPAACSGMERELFFARVDWFIFVPVCHAGLVRVH
jgi:hypothetical protein